MVNMLFSIYLLRIIGKYISMCSIRILLNEKGVLINVHPEEPASPFRCFIGCYKLILYMVAYSLTDKEGIISIVYIDFHTTTLAYNH